MNSNNIMAFVGSAFLAMALISVTSNAETLATAVELALQKHPAIKAALSMQAAAAEDVNISKAQFHPRIELNATNRFLRSSTGEGDVIDLQLLASQSLYDGGVKRSDLLRSKAELGAEEQRVADQMNEVGLQSVQAYIDILRTKENLQVLDRDRKLLDDIARRVRLRVSAGFGSDTDILDVELKIQNAELNRIDARDQARRALIEYRNIMGTEPGKLAPVAFPAKAMPPDIETAVELATHSSPRIRSLIYDANAADAISDGVKAAQRPKLELDVGLNQSREIGKTWTESHDMSARLVLKVDLYDGGSSKAKSRKARHSAYATRYRAKSTAAALDQQLRLMWSTLDTARERITVLRLQQKATRRSLGLHLKRFDAGLDPLERILDLQSQNTTADMAEISERFSRLSNGFRFLAGTGRLLPAIGLNSITAIDQNG